MESKNCGTCLQISFKSMNKQIILFGERLNSYAFMKKSHAFYYEVPKTDINTLNMYILPTEEQAFRVNVDQPSVSVQEMEANLNKIKSIPFEPPEDLTHECIDDFIKLLLRFKKGDCEKQTCFREFTTLFGKSLSSLYIEHKICQYLQQNKGHIFGKEFAECMVCRRIIMYKEQCTIGSLNREGASEDCLNSDTQLKVELLMSLKDIGYNLDGTNFMINGMMYRDTRPLVFLAVEKGELSWIEACIAAGADLNSEHMGVSLFDTKMNNKDWDKSCRIMKLLVSNGADIKSQTMDMFDEQAKNAIKQNDSAFLQWLLGLGLNKEEEKMLSLIKTAAGAGHYLCLSVS